MRFIDVWRQTRQVPDRLASVAVASPWAGPSPLAGIVADWDIPEGALTREEAMSVPAVARCRHLIAGTIGLLPMTLHAGDRELPSPPWMDRTDGAMSPYHRMLWTIDDLIFYGWSVWSVERGAEDAVLTMTRVPPDQWSFGQAPTGQTVVMLGDRPAEPGKVCLIPGPHEGLVVYGRRCVRHASLLVDAADRAAETPVPNVELHQTTDAPMSQDQILALVDQWAKARRGVNGGVAYTNSAVEARFHGQTNGQLLIEGRNAAAVDIARAMGIPASMIDATTATASLTYETTTGRNGEFLTYGLSPYMASVSARLGMDDIVPRGQSVRWDLSDFTSPAEPGKLEVPDDTAGVPA